MQAKVSPLSVRARWVLRIALVLAWASGVAGTVTSCAVLSHYRGPIPQRVASVSPSASTSSPASVSAAASTSSLASAVPSVAVAPSASAPAARTTLGITEAEAEVMTDAFERFRKTRLPLTAANFVLSVALVIGAARTLGRRAGGRAWLQQVCLATALYAGTEYLASREERAWLAEQIPAVRVLHVDHTGLTREQAEATFRASVRFSFLLKLFGQLALYGGLALALGRPSVIAELVPAEGSRPSMPPSSSSNDDDES